MQFHAEDAGRAAAPRLRSERKFASDVAFWHTNKAQNRRRNSALAGENVKNQKSFARRLPKAAKSTAGRTNAPQVPANIRVFGVDLSQDERAHVRHGLGVKLGKYETSIERVTVRVLDVNGPRGGVDKLCRIKVVLSGLPSVVFESQALSLKAAINGALAGAERAVRRSVQRRHTKPIKAATRGAAR